MKAQNIFLFFLLVLTSILAASCVSLFSETFPNMMLSNPDGTLRLVWDYKNKTMTIDDPETLEVKRVWKGASAATVKSIGFSRDGRYLVFVSEKKIKVWDVKRDAIHITLESEGDPMMALISNDNQYIAVKDIKGLSMYLNVWSLKDDRLLWRKETGFTSSLEIAFDNSSNLVATEGGDEEILIFSTASGYLDRTITIGKKESVDTLQFSPSGEYLAAGMVKENPEVRLWDIRSGMAKLKCQMIGHTSRLGSDGIIFNYNEKYLASGALDPFEENPSKRFEAIIWEINRCRKVRTIQEFTAIGTSTDGRFFVWDNDLNRMRVYFWGGEWIHEITGMNMFKSINELVWNLTDGISETRKPVIAIANFAPISINQTSLEKFLSEEFIARITLTQKFRVVERQQIQKILDELRLSVSDLVEPAQAKEFGRLLGAEYLLVGTITDEKFGLKVNARIIKTETGEVFKASSTTILKDPMIKNLLEDRV